MYLLLNNKEIAHFLVSLIDYKKILDEIDFSWKHTDEFIMNCDPKYFTNEKFIPKFKERIKKSIESDLNNYVTCIKDTLISKKTLYFDAVHDNIEFFLSALGEKNVLDAYKKSKKENFVKTTGKYLSKSTQLIRRNKFIDYNQPCLIRNTVGNEDLLVSKLDNNYPFWFIDSGYTNFLEPNKKWHRVVNNHLHYGGNFTAPVDRLGVFKNFPQQWRNDGEKILIVEPGPFAAAVFHIDLNTWKYDVEKEIRKYSDKKIVFREKVDKKIRSNLYKEFCDEDYYCVVNLNSNAATEAIWAGIPVITLGKHITNAVSKSKLSDINNLAKPNLANWLCMLSYSQFTYEELTNGKAIHIVRKYHV